MINLAVERFRWTVYSFPANVRACLLLLSLRPSLPSGLRPWNCFIDSRAERRDNTTGCTVGRPAGTDKNIYSVIVRNCARVQSRERIFFLLTGIQRTDDDDDKVQRHERRRTHTTLALPLSVARFPPPSPPSSFSRPTAVSSPFFSGDENVALPVTGRS